MTKKSLRTERSKSKKTTRVRTLPRVARAKKLKPAVETPVPLVPTTPADPDHTLVKLAEAKDTLGSLLHSIAEAYEEENENFRRDLSMVAMKQVLSVKNSIDFAIIYHNHVTTGTGAKATVTP